jgi:RNA polymerase sigma-70 factor (ECF subfamily)
VDDRLALLLVACDPALAPGAQMVLALRVVCGLSIAETAQHLGIQETAAAARLTRAKRALAAARGEFVVPEAAEQLRRLPVVLDCVAGMFTVAHRAGLEPPDALADTGRQALSIADALVEAFPADTEVRGLRAVVRLGLARRPARVDAEGAALTLEEMDRSRWDPVLVRGGLADATLAAGGQGRFALEAAISGLHTVAPSVSGTDWPRIVQLYDALQRTWPSPAVEVARLTALGRADPSTVPDCEQGLLRLAEHGPPYARRDAAFALADLCWRGGRREEAARRYRELAAAAHHEAVRRFCERRART